MKNLLLVMALLMCGCAGGTKVVPTKPLSRNYNITPTIEQDSKETTPPSYSWMVLWLSSVALAGFATYRTFKKK
tara:strand:+ start:4522 stop:4743 length:222 start_codon:yes stop_codon:yes gene_type:complete